MLNFLISKIYIFYDVIIILICANIVRFALIITEQRWAKSFHNLIIYNLLPIITFVITKIISNNIALSLGMVGALSIVRFRNPVKNSLELVFYFYLITLGIAGSVSKQWGILLSVVCFLVIIISWKLLKINLLSRTLNLSFDEGLKKFFLEIELNRPEENLEKNKFLANFNYNYDKSSFVYHFVSSRSSDLEEIKNNLKNTPSLKCINFISG